MKWQANLSPCVVLVWSDSLLTRPEHIQFMLLVVQPKSQPHFEALAVDPLTSGPSVFFFKSWRRQERDWVLEYTQTKGNLRENMVSFAVHHMAVKCPFRTSFLVAKLIKVACSVMVCNLTFTFFVIYVPWFGRVCFKRDLRIFPIYLIIFISLFFERLPLSLQTRILYPWYPRCMSNCHYILLKWKTFYYSAYLSSSSSLLAL